MIHSTRITVAAASVCHTVLVDSSGEWMSDNGPVHEVMGSPPLLEGHVYTCGKGEGILGHGDTAIHTVPKRVESLDVSPWEVELIRSCLELFYQRPTL